MGEMSGAGQSLRGAMGRVGGDDADAHRGSGVRRTSLSRVSKDHEGPYRAETGRGLTRRFQLGSSPPSCRSPPW